MENPFEEVNEHWLHWFNICLKEKSDDERMCMWLSTVDHLLGNHNNCKHKNGQDFHVWTEGEYTFLSKNQHQDTILKEWSQ